MTRRRLKTSAILVVVVIAGLVCGISYLPKRLIPLPSGSVNNVLISITPSIDDMVKSDKEGTGRPVPYSVNCSDMAGIQELVSVLRTARANEDHKCPDSGAIVLSFGAVETHMTILPGHEDEFYELRLDGHNYRLKRKPFVAALIKCGVSADKIALGRLDSGSTSR